MAGMCGAGVRVVALMELRIFAYMAILILFTFILTACLTRLERPLAQRKIHEYDERTNRTQVMSKSHAQAWTHARRHMRGQPQESTHARNHGRRNAASTHGRTNSRTDTRIHAHMDARTDERSHGHTHTRTDGRTDGGSDGRRHTCAHPRVHLLTGRRIHACTRRFG